MAYGARAWWVSLVCVATGCWQPAGSLGQNRGGGGIVDAGVSVGEGPVDLAVGSPSPQPSFGATVSRAVAPPPLSGGTLLALDDGRTAVAADPDRDQVYLVDVPSAAVRTVALSPQDEPGRVASDGNNAFVALRRGGAVATIDLASGMVLDRRAVCAAPRGITWDASRTTLWVACLGGELVKLPSTGAPTATYLLAPDLRDVVAGADGVLYVSTFRAAEILSVDPATGTVLARTTPDGGPGAAPDGAWRMVARPASVGGGVVVAHQMASTQVVSTSSGGYTSQNMQAVGIVASAITTVGPGGAASGPFLIPGFVLPVDIAVSGDGSAEALVSAGSAHTAVLTQVEVFARTSVTPFAGTGIEPTAVAWMPDMTLLVQSREPAALVVVRNGQVASKIPLDFSSVADTGHAIFHANSGGNIACASCHLEGGDDGRTWNFDAIGPRRTPSLRFGITGTEPFHWRGEMADLSMLVEHVFVERMSGPMLSGTEETALRHFLDGIPRLPAPTVDPAAAARGKALFEDPNGAACINCHRGAKLTDNLTVDVGTGGAFQVPSLVGVAWHPPYLHDGRAATLRDRFDASLGGGDQHGLTSQLTPSQIDDLVAYLETL